MERTTISVPTPDGTRPPGRARRSLRRHRTAYAASACGGWLLATAIPAAAQQSLLPATGVGGTPEDLRGNLEQFLPAAPTPSIERAWVIKPSIGVDVGVTDNPGGVSKGGTSFFTDINPDIYVQGDTARATVRLDYSPQIYLYSNGGNSSFVSQNFSGSAVVTVVPNFAFLDVRGLITEQSRFGQANGATFGQQNTVFLGNQDAVQTSSFSVTPYLEHRFGGWGTGRLGYSYVRTFQDAYSGPDTFNSPYSTLGYGNLGNLTTQRERATFVTGENLGRFNDAVTVQAIQYSGNGTYRNAHRNEFTNEFGYAVTPSITALAGIGYQDLRYSGFPDGYRLQEPTWNVGARWTPNPDSSFTILFGRHDGGTQVSFDGTYAPGAHTRIYARYTTGITTSLEDQQAILDTTNVGPNGLLVDSVTGAPVTGTGAFGINNALSRVRRLSLTLVWQLDRDTVTASVVNEEDVTLTSSASFLGPIVPPNTRSNSTIGSLAWLHQLSPTTSLFANGSYGVVDNGALLGVPSSGSQTEITAGIGIAHTFTETLTGHATYTYSERSGGAGNNIPSYYGGNASQNTFLVGIRKSF